MKDPKVAQRRFKFAWSRTWADREQDFVAVDGERQIGRVYRLPGVDERWKWSMTASIGNRLGSTAGSEATRDEACDAVERAYEELKAAIGRPDGDPD